MARAKLREAYKYLTGTLSMRYNRSRNMYQIEGIKNQIFQGDALIELKKFPDNSVDCIITSPPYWGLRDYGIEGQIGLEPTLEEYLEKLLKITAELKRVLKPSGVLFWNHGDCYSAQRWTGSGKGQAMNKFKDGYRDINPEKNSGLDDKTLVLQNYKLILGMVYSQKWLLRNTIIWHKPNHMPSSVKDRLANSYEPVFMLVKNKKYAFDLDAVRVPHSQATIERMKYGWNETIQEKAGLGGKIYQGFTREKLMKWRDRFNFNYRVRDAEKKSEQCPQFKATEEEIERYGKSASHNWKLRNTPNPMEWRKIAQTHYPQDQAENFGSPRARYWRELKEIQKYSGSPGRRAKLTLLEGKLTTKVKKKLLDVGNYLKQRIKEANLNPQKLADLTGLKETTIAHYFRTDFSGQALPDKNTWDILKPILNLGDYENFIDEEIRSALPNPYPLGKNPGDVWNISTQPAPSEVRGKFFAIFPEKLVEPMILAGCPKEVCKKCGKSRERIIKENIISKRKPEQGVMAKNVNNYGNKGLREGIKNKQYQTIGWTSCNCNTGFEPGIVLDPFFGSGTVGVIAKRLRRNYIGIELSPDYVKIAEARIKAQPEPLF